MGARGPNITLGRLENAGMMGGMQKFDFIHSTDAPPEDTEFWCANCDGGPVKASDPATGRWYLVSGHKWNGSISTPMIGEDYHMIVFALCSACDPFPTINALVEGEGEPSVHLESLREEV